MEIISVAVAAVILGVSWEAGRELGRWLIKKLNAGRKTHGRR